MRATIAAVWALGTLVFGCGERRDGFDVPPRVVDRARLGSELLFVDASQDQVSALDVMSRDLSANVIRIPVGAGPRLAIERSTFIANPVLAASSFAAEDIGVALADSRLAPDEVLVLCD
ncbi:MAG TPA: hypothetical protein VKP30_18850, partial [Polyangiaceae bacterium]|nr:hypothetical protein [Polyangiaceae bacterium]